MMSEQEFVALFEKLDDVNRLAALQLMEMLLEEQKKQGDAQEQ